MKTAEIQAGKAYSNGKGRCRLVTAAGEMPLMPTADKDYVQYRPVMADSGMLGPPKVMTRNSFAKWASERVPEYDEEV